MNSQISNSDIHAILQLLMNQLNTFNQVVEQLQVQINELSSQILTSMLTRLNTSEEIIIIIIITTKSEKLSDSLMFNKN